MDFSFGTLQTFALGFTVVFLILYWVNKPKLCEGDAPMVPYKFPIIGHTFTYLFDAKNFLTESRIKYGDPFNIYIFGQVTTITGYETAQEIYKYFNVFDFRSATKETFPIHLVIKGVSSADSLKDVIKTIREEIVGKIPLYITRMQEELMIGVDKEIGNCQNPKVLHNVPDHFARIISRPVASILVGEELSKSEDLINSFATVTKDLGSMMAIPPFLSFIHPKLHIFAIALPLLIGWNPIKVHKETFKKHIKPELEKRLREKETLGDKYNPPLDILEYYSNKTKVITDEFVDNLVELLLNFVFVSIHTTTTHATAALYDLGGRPEFWDDLYEEQEKIDKESNGVITKEAVDKMVKLDSFLRESLRNIDNIAELPHKCMAEKHTFKNGATIPKGRLVYLYTMDLHHNIAGPEAKTFDPYRGLKDNTPATKVDKNLYTFGSGRHACPGRFFAVNEIKMWMHKLILNYHIKTESGKVEEKKYFGFHVMPRKDGLVFVNRNK